MKKTITILLPAYNEEACFDHLQECMNKVLAENPAYEWELMFVQVLLKIEYLILQFVRLILDLFDSPNSSYMYYYIKL